MNALANTLAIPYPNLTPGPYTSTPHRFPTTSVVRSSFGIHDLLGLTPGFPPVNPLPADPFPPQQECNDVSVAAAGYYIKIILLWILYFQVIIELLNKIKSC